MPGQVDTRVGSFTMDGKTDCPLAAPFAPHVSEPFAHPVAELIAPSLCLTEMLGATTQPIKMWARIETADQPVEMSAPIGASHSPDARSKISVSCRVWAI